ncbi:hypothetical protein PG996_007948 [Apiospora saccharicola]|uniref:Uncharacterized protein n=1 Tax=Apiospora saccharicola TaxID=335842 RepID=A0ABR1UWI3_9PEZI
MAEQSEHRPRGPTWTVQDLEGRYEVAKTFAEAPDVQAELEGHETFDYLCRYLYNRYIYLLQDVQGAVAGAAADKKRGGSMAAEFRAHGDKRDLLKTLLHLETKVLQDFNGTLLRMPLERFAREWGPFHPADEKDQERLRWLANAIADFRFLQDPTEPLYPAYGQRLRPHFRWMQKFINDCLPAPQDLWEDGDLKGNSEFENLWTEFKALKTDGGIDGDGNTVPNTDAENRHLVAESQVILQWALDALQLKAKDIEADWAYMQDPNHVPSYTVYPPYDPLFWEGQATADGARDLACYLGWDEDETTFRSHMGTDKPERDASAPPPPPAKVARIAALPEKKREAVLKTVLAKLESEAAAKMMQSVARKLEEIKNNKRPSPGENDAAAAASGPERKRRKREMMQKPELPPRPPNLPPSQVEPARLNPKMGWTEESIREALGRGPHHDQGALLEQQFNRQQFQPYDGTDEFYGDEDEDEDQDEVYGDEDEEDEDADEDMDADEIYENQVYNLDDAINDMMMLRSDLGLGNPLGPKVALVTPPEPLKEETRKSYEREWRAFAAKWEEVWKYVQELNKEHWHMKDHPTSTPYARRSIRTDALLQATVAKLEAALRQEEDVLKSTRPHLFKGGVPARLKAWRMTAWRSRYLRCLHLCLLCMAGDVDPADFDAVYDRRLEDIIEHEQAWMEADQYALEKQLKTPEAKKDARERIKARKANIKSYNEYLEDGGQVTSGATETETDTDTETETPQQQQPAAPTTPKPKTKRVPPPPTTTTPAFVPNPLPVWPSTRMRPEHEQQLQKLMQRIAAHSHHPPGEKMKEDLGPYAIEMPEGPVLGSLAHDPGHPTARRPAADPRSARKFAAGGPPAYETLPTGTVFEKLQYMIILTLWRCSLAATTGLKMIEVNKDYENGN